MAEYLIDKAYLVALADAIRSKSGSSSQMVPSEMISAINNLGDMSYTPPSSSVVINKTGEPYTTQDTTLNNLANAIRSKASISDKMTPHNMVDVVNGLAEVEKIAFAVFSADDNSLNFYKRTDVPKVGEQFEGKTATEVYTGIETDTYSGVDNTPWSSKRSSITNIKAVDKIKPVSMSYMFCGCSNLTSLDVSRFDTSNVASMDAMFMDCSKLASLNVSGFNTGSATNMGRMFIRCSNLTSLEVSRWNTEKVATMVSMFQDCSKLVVDCSMWDVSKVIIKWYFASGAPGVKQPNWK